MSQSKKRKVDAECRVFQEKWSASYLFTEVNGKAVCLVCSQHVSVLKGYNLHHHCQSFHANEYNNFQGQQRREKVNEMLAVLKKQQSVFTIFTYSVAYKAVSKSTLSFYFSLYGLLS